MPPPHPYRRPPPDAGVPALTPKELADELAGPSPPWVLDVRPAAERRWARLAGAATIPLAELPQRRGEVPGDRTVVVVCRTGFGSHQGAAFLRAQGHPDVLTLEGGLDAYARDVDPTLGRYVPLEGDGGWLLRQWPRTGTGCLSYLIADLETARAALLDPGPDAAPYLEELRARDLSLSAIVETHTHADHIAGHAELHRRTGAPIWVGRRSPAQYSHRDLAEGDHVELGRASLTVLETPGHTSDHLTLRFHDKIFTGDTLLVGSCGRTDLGDGSPAALWESLRTKILPLPDATEVLPAHYGAHHGLPDRYGSTLGLERATNEALRQPDWESFRRYMEEGWPPKPADFDRIVAANLAAD